MNIIAEASNGRESIHEFRALRPDATLMDLPMPEMNGLDAIIAIRGEFHGARKIVLTTYTGDVQVLRLSRWERLNYRSSISGTLTDGSCRRT